MCEDYRGAWTVVLKMAAGIAGAVMVCVWACIWGLMAIFPQISQGGGYQDMLSQLPSGMLQALGMTGDASRLNSYLDMNFYNSIYLYILMALVIALSTKILPGLIDNGSLVYFLNGTLSRKAFLLMQMAICYLSVLLTGCVSLVSVAAGRPLFHIASSLDWSALIAGNALLASLFLMLCAVCLLIGSCCSRSTTSIGITTTLLVGEYVLSMVAKLAPSVKALPYTTVFSLYDNDRLTSSSYCWTCCLVLLLATLALSLSSLHLFNRRDLYI